MTLLELLVVVTILLIIAGATIPRLRPMMESQRTREASRAVHLYLSAARQLAMSEGRPCGVRFERLMSPSATGGAPTSIESRCSVTLSQVQVPVPYGGSSANSCVKLQVNSGNLKAKVMVGDCSSLAGVRINDWVQLNGQGPRYQILRAPTTSSDPTLIDFSALQKDPADTAYYPIDTGAASDTSDLGLQPDPSSTSAGQQYPWPTWTAPAFSPPVAFTILRQPAKTVAAPLQLPSPAAVDLTWSGPEFPPPPGPPPGGMMTVPQYLASNLLPKSWGYGPDPVTIMFSPNGGLAGLYLDVWNPGLTPPKFVVQSQAITGTAFIMIGKRDSIVPVVPPGPDTLPSSSTDDTIGDPNIDDTDSLLIAINPGTGLITTTDLAPSTVVDNSSTDDQPTQEYKAFQKLYDMRSYGRQSDSMGGR